MGKASRSAATAISPAGLGGQGRWNALGRWRGLRAYPRGRGVENHQYAPQGRQRGMRKTPPVALCPLSPQVNSGNLMLALTFSAFGPGCVKTPCCCYDSLVILRGKLM